MNKPPDREELLILYVELSTALDLTKAASEKALAIAEKLAAALDIETGEGGDYDR